MIKRLCIFAASSDRIDDLYKIQAYELGNNLAQLGIEIIYGGGKRGLMGSLSSGAIDSEGVVIGVIPQFMQELEWGRDDVSELHEVETMHQRESKMFLESDAIAALPGGIGTLEELTQAIAWKLLGIISKPIYIVNVNNYFNPFLEQMKLAVSEGYMREEHLDLWKVFDNCDELVEEIKLNSIN
jgi:hypothetical protein